MPYNTRRKSLSLPSLGIQLPHGSRAHQSPSAYTKGDQPPSKKVKRDHSPLINSTNCYEPTQPLSPPPETPVNYSDINDEIVSGVVRILERTGNRPHTVKELAVTLAPTLNIVENSANPHAIISSRLNGYLKRGFTRSTPCLLKKKLITTHPRRIYFYLTTTPHQPIPQHESETTVYAQRSVISPALSDEEEEELRCRTEMSPSPEVDLSSHELDDGAADAEDALSSTAASMIARERTRSPSTLENKSPPLEGDEREFSQSAIYLERRSKEAAALSSSSPSPSKDDSPKRLREEYDDATASEEILDYVLAPAASAAPVVKQEDPSSVYSWGGELERHLGSPESVELDELDDLLDF